MHIATSQYCATQAEQIASSHRPADVNSPNALLRRWLPAAGRILEVGCSIGREAAFIFSIRLEVSATGETEVQLHDLTRNKQPLSWLAVETKEDNLLEFVFSGG